MPTTRGVDAQHLLVRGREHADGVVLARADAAVAEEAEAPRDHVGVREADDGEAPLPHRGGDQGGVLVHHEHGEIELALLRELDLLGERVALEHHAEPRELARLEDLPDEARGAAALGPDADAQARELPEVHDGVGALAQKEDRLGLAEARVELEPGLLGEGYARLHQRGLHLAARGGGGEALHVLHRAVALHVVDAPALAAGGGGDRVGDDVVVPLARAGEQPHVDVAEVGPEIHAGDEDRQRSERHQGEDDARAFGDDELGSGHRRPSSGRGPVERKGGRARCPAVAAATARHPRRPSCMLRAR